MVIWHWAHYPDSDRRTPCGHRETAWHLAWKSAYDRLAGWTVEQHIDGFRADAANLHTRSLREFIHCLSPYYAIKHRLFAALDFDVRWIFDGDAFGSQRLRTLSRGGVSRLLTPRAYALHVELNRRCWVHRDGQLWKEWRDNVWYPRTDDAAARLLAAFDSASKDLDNPQGVARRFEPLSRDKGPGDADAAAAWKELHGGTRR
jgi:hypothetical protein